MSAFIPGIAALPFPLLGYRVSSRYAADRVFRIHPDEAVPAHPQRDGIDCVPTSRGVLWGATTSPPSPAPPPSSIYFPVNLEIIVAVALGWWAYKLQRKMLIPSLLILV